MIVFAYVSEHCANFGTKNLIGSLVRERGGGLQLYTSFFRTEPAIFHHVLHTQGYSCLHTNVKNVLFFGVGNYPQKMNFLQLK